MMKQPAENINATRQEVESTIDRASRIIQDSQTITEEVAKLAYSYWQERNDVDGSPDEDWFRAEKFVRNRITATVTG